MKTTVIGIVGSYRRGGAIDRLVSAALEGAHGKGAETEKVYLADVPIEFCRNCRACTQRPGTEPGQCVHSDGMRDLLERCLKADGLVLGAPVNFFNVNALTRRFMERLVCLAYWPWGQGSPRMRVAGTDKGAVLIAASAMPAAMGRVLTGALRALRLTARTLGAKPVASVFAGLAAQHEKPDVSRRALQRALAAGRKLVRD